MLGPSCSLLRKCRPSRAEEASAFLQELHGAIDHNPGFLGSHGRVEPIVSLDAAVKLIKQPAVKFRVNDPGPGEVLGDLSKPGTNFIPLDWHAELRR